MGLFSKLFDRCPRCGGPMDLDSALGMRETQKRINSATSYAGQLAAISDAFAIGGDTYYSCKNCGYAEKRRVTDYGVSKTPLEE